MFCQFCRVGWLAVFGVLFFLCLAFCPSASLAQNYAPVDLSGFEDGIEHYVLATVDTDYERYKPEQIVEIAENLVLYQSEDGGWVKNLDWLKIVTPEQAVEEKRPRLKNGSTLDNRNTTPQIRYLAEVYKRTGIERYRFASLRGIRYVFATQNASGGWAGVDVDAITYNDDITVGALELLREIVRHDPLFVWIDSDLRGQAATSLERGIDAILKTQIVWNGNKTAWCQQHDHVTHKPVKARSYELASICGSESVGVVKFLMEIKDPSPEIVDAIESAVKWFEDMKIRGLRIERRPIEPYRNKGGRLVARDVVMVADPDVRPIWARFYDLEKSEPMFVRRSGEIVPAFEDISQERRDGYAWYGYWPATLIDREYPSWRKRLLSSDKRRLDVSGD